MQTDNISSVEHTGRQPVKPKAMESQKVEDTEMSEANYGESFPDVMGFQQIKSVQNINFAGNVFLSDP